ncbi:hypothetical protein EDD11_008251 [Mortierella claussenii]|nr:hypothetical protein EDD11_008251 [Mortierella claussenii]
MEEKKKSTLGKAFARTFSRKAPVSSTPAVAAPVAAPAPTKPIDTPPSHDTLAPASPPVSSNPFSPPDSTNASRVASSVNDDSPKSPQNHSIHLREGTGVSNASTSSRHGQNSEDGEGLNPADILLNRLTAFKGVIKNLQVYFAEVAEVEIGVSKAMNKTSGVIIVPFKDGQQFLGKGGLQDVCIGLKDSAKARSDQHASSARFVEETIVKNLRRLKQDIKGRIKALKADTNLYSNKVFKERELTQERIATLAKAIGLFDMSGQHQPDMEKMNSDPYVINISLKRQLAKQVHEENLFARALKQCQDEIKTFEAHIIKEVKQILAAFADYQLSNATNAFSQSWAPTQLALNVLQEDSEWNNFLEKHGHRLFPSDLVDANPDDLNYPCKDSPYVVPLKTAHMSRQSSVLKNWREGYFVLTLAGWLHVFGSADQGKDAIPEHSIYLPTATLGPHTETGQKQHVFSIDGKGKGGLLHRDAQTFTEEMIEWWGELSKRAQSSTFTQPGDGTLNAISRSGSVTRSSSMIQPKSPDHTRGPSPPYVAQEQHPIDEKTAHAPAPALTSVSTTGSPAVHHVEPATVAAEAAPAFIPAPIPATPGAVPAPASTDAPVLERTHTDSTVSVHHGETTPIVASSAPAPVSVPAVTPAQ